MILLWVLRQKNLDDNKGKTVAEQIPISQKKNAGNNGRNG
jgi:hypothetical protein